MFIKNKINLVKFLTKYIRDKYPNKYNFSTPNQKHSLESIIDSILFILQTGMSFNQYGKLGIINKKTLYNHLNFFKKKEIFKFAYIELLNQYFKKNKCRKLKFQLIDSSFIPNQYGIENIGRNKYYKNKQGYKLSLITDVYGIPFSILIENGSKNDAKMIDNHFNNLLIETNTNRYKDHNRYKQYFLADKMYDTKEFRKKITDKGYSCIIDYNKRNTKNINKIKKLTKVQKQKYKKRLKIENCFSWCFPLENFAKAKRAKPAWRSHILIDDKLSKKNKRIKEINEKKMDAYISFVYLALIKKIFIN